MRSHSPGGQASLLVGFLTQGEEIRSLARELNLTIPSWGLQRIVQSKAWKVRVLVEAARTLDDSQVEPNASALTRLAGFIDAFEAISPDDIDGPAAWASFVSRYAEEGWKGRLGFDLLLQNFGFESSFARRLRSMEHVVKVGGTEGGIEGGGEERQTLEQFSMRWLSKALAGYNVNGCLADLVNLMFAMSNTPPPSEEGQVTHYKTAGGAGGGEGIECELRGNVG